METVRRSVFETNSSSSHSITIETGGNWDNIPLNDKGNVVLEGGEFGWGIDTYRDAFTKANYCAVDQFHHDDNTEMLKRVIKNYTGCNKVKIKISLDWDKGRYSYIDHQSHGTTTELFHDEEQLKNFIFNRNSVLLIDNDNH